MWGEDSLLSKIDRMQLNLRPQIMQPPISVLRAVMTCQHDGDGGLCSHTRRGGVVGSRLAREVRCGTQTLALERESQQSRKIGV